MSALTQWPVLVVEVGNGMISILVLLVGIFFLAPIRDLFSFLCVHIHCLEAQFCAESDLGGAVSGLISLASGCFTFGLRDPPPPLIRWRWVRRGGSGVSEASYLDVAKKGPAYVGCCLWMVYSFLLARRYCMYALNLGHSWKFGFVQ
jgi:hypothetical protein